MKSMNRVQLIGYLGRDPEIRELQNGSSMACLNLATSHWKLHSEKERELVTSWHKIRVWGKERVDGIRTLIKGSHVLVTGQIVYREYPNKEGKTTYVTEIHAYLLVDLDR